MPTNAELHRFITLLKIEIEACAVALEHTKTEFVHSLERGQVEVAALGFQFATFQGRRRRRFWAA